MKLELEKMRNMPEELKVALRLRGVSYGWNCQQGVRCLLCGQSFCYEDIAEMRELDRARV